MYCTDFTRFTDISLKTTYMVSKKFGIGELSSITWLTMKAMYILYRLKLVSNSFSWLHFNGFNQCIKLVVYNKKKTIPF